MERYHDAPQILRDFLSYHETIKGQSRRTVSEYYLDLRMFLRFLKLMRCEMPYNTPLEDIPIVDIDAAFMASVKTSEIFDFLSYLSNDRENPESPDAPGINTASRARKLSAIKSFYKYLTVSTKQITENPVKDIEFPKIRKSLPKYLTLEESTALLRAVDGPNQTRDFAILMLFLNCGIRRAELVGLNRNDVYNDRIRVTGKGNKERFVYFGETTREALDTYLPERNKIVLDDDRALFGSRDHRRLSVTAVHRRMVGSVSHGDSYRGRLASRDSAMETSLWFDERFTASRNRFRILRRRHVVGLWLLSWKGAGVGEYLARWWADLRRTPRLVFCPEGAIFLVKKILFRRKKQHL